jgi:PKD repeat protein
MTRHLARVVLITFALTLFARASEGQSARSLGFHGPLRDVHGKAVTTPADLVFRLYDAPSGGNLVAGPFGPFRVSPVRGEYSATFGPVPVAQFDGPRWLEVTLEGSPLRRLEMEKVYYDWIDEHGKLTGDRTLTLSTRKSFDALAPQAPLRPAVSVSTILDNGPSSNRIDLVYVGDGYLESELGVYATNVQATLGTLLSQEPFASYRTLFNAHRVDVVSNESGVDNDPDLGINRDTALDMGFWCGGTERLLCVDVGKAYQFASLARATDHVYAIANSTKYGGAGYIFNDLATISGGNGAAAEIGVHETGHSLGNLADEYETGGPLTYTGPEPIEPNISTLSAGAMAGSGTKWARWLGDPRTEFGGLVDTYEGAGYSRFGLYRPTVDSKMRTLGQAFNLPSVESLILEFYKIVRPIDGATPAGTLLDEFSTVFVDPVDPPGHPLEIRWYLDGNAVQGETHETFRLCTGGTPVGDHMVSVTVRDTTSWVRDEDQRNQWLTESRSWNLHIGGSNHDDCAPFVTAPAAATGEEGALLSFTVDAVDPNGDAIGSLTAAGTAITAGGTFAADPSNASGTFQWTPGFDRAGTYEVTFTAANALIGSATTSITVRNVNLPPSVSAPATVSGAENVLITFAVSAADPDGETITFSADPLPTDATFLDHENNTGTFSWVPSFDQAGSYPVTFTGLDGGGASGTAQTAITVAPTDRAPAIVAPTARIASEGELLTFPVTASDPDGEPILSLAASDLPSGATFAWDGTSASGSFTWSPDYSQAGTYSVTFTASNALQAVATTSIVVNNAARLPVVAAPDAVSGAEGSALAFAVSASDPDGEPIDSLTVASLPPGSTFTVDSERTSGAFHWTPDFAQSGEYAVTISAQSACRASVVSGVVEVECDTGTATVAIHIANTDRPPIVDAPVSRTVNEGAALTFAVSAMDPDSEAIGSLSAAALPPGATFTQSSDNKTGTFAWTPGFAQSGSYSVTFTASNDSTGLATTAITVVDRSPTLSAPGAVTVDENQSLTFGVTATDPDGGHVTLTATTSLPTGATFADNGDNTGTFSWTPNFTQAGSYTVNFLGTNPGGGTGDAGTAITVSDVNRAPISNPSGPYSGVVGTPVRFEGGESSDPDGNGLRYYWDFDSSDGISIESTSQSPDHTYALGGSYTVTLDVDDGGAQDPGSPVLTATGTTSANIQSTFAARVFSKNPTIRLHSGKPTWCAQIEPVSGDFGLGDVNPSSVVLKYGTRQIAAVAGKAAVVGDKDGNGITEIEICWSKTDLRTLLAGLPSGHTSVPVAVEGDLTAGGRFSGTLSVDVISNGSFLAVWVSPNPPRPRATLTILTTKPGFARVQLFDLMGRLARTLMDERYIDAGYHDVTIDGRGKSGDRLSSGVYFYRVETAEGVSTGRLAIMR